MTENEIYISVNDLAELKGVTSRAIRLSISRGRYVARETEVHGGTSYEVLLSSTEKHVQQRYFEQETNSAIENHLPATKEKDFIPQSAKETALARMDLLKEWRKFRNSHHKKTSADRAFLESYNSGILYEKIFLKIGSVSIGTLKRWNKILGCSSDYTILIPNYSYSKQHEFRTTLTEQEKNIFMKLILHPNKFSVGKAISITKHVLKKQGQEYIPSTVTFRRFAKWFRDNNYDKWVLARGGESELKNKVAPYIVRDVSVLNVSDVLVADGHRLSFQILNPFTGKPARAVLLGFLDWKSGYLCGYDIMLEEDTQAIASALRNSIINLKTIPKIVYQDNGRAFKAKYFCNTDFRESGFSGLYGRLGIKVVFAKPYNARAKVIERFFLEFQESFEKLVPSYTGSSIQNQPARLKRNEKIHRELHEKIHNNYVPTIQEVKQLVDSWLEFKHSQPCPNDRTRSIKEVFDSREKQNININELDELMMAHEVKTIHRNGIRFLNTDYYNDALYGLRDRVIIRYSLFDLSYVKVYTAKGEYLCTAKRVEATHPMAHHMGSVTDMQSFKQKIKKQKQLRNRTLRTIKKYIQKEDVKFIESQMIEENNPVNKAENQIAKQEPIVFEEKLRSVFMNGYEKYEYLMREGCTIPEERKWLAEYMKSDEYKQIYEEI